MQLETQKYLNRNSAVIAFVADRAPFLETWPRVIDLRDRLQDLSGDIAALVTGQESSGGTSSQKVVLKQTLIDALTHDLQDMARTAKSMAEPIPVSKRSSFFRPVMASNPSWARREFQINATPAAIKAEFIASPLECSPIF